MLKKVRCPLCGGVAEPLKLFNKIFYDCLTCQETLLFDGNNLLECRGEELTVKHGFTYIDCLPCGAEDSCPMFPEGDCDTCSFAESDD